MSRQTIAIDIDDVLADQAAAFVDYSNKQWGTNLRVSDYTEHWAELWGVDVDEVRVRSDMYHDSGTIGRFEHKPEALPVLRRLRDRYSLVIVTSRRRIVKDETLNWIQQHFEGLFDDIHFAGFFDDLSDAKWSHTKAEVVVELGADYLIDDQPKHCLATAEAGVDSILFGNYPWNQLDELPSRVARCNNWADEERYFDGT